MKEKKVKAEKTTIPKEPKTKTKAQSKVKGTGWETKLGRPVEFDADKAIKLMQQEIDKYLSGKMKTYQYVDKDPNDEEKGKFVFGKFDTTITKISLACGVTRDTFTDHCIAKNEDGSIKNDQLFRTYIMYRELGAQVLIEGGATGLLRDNFVQFVGNVNFGLIPVTKAETTVEVKSMKSVYDELDKIHNDELARVEQQKDEMIKRRKQFDKEFEEEN